MILSTNFLKDYLNIDFDTDEKLHELVYKKGKMSDIIVDKEVDAVTNEKMVQFLLS